MAQLKEFLKRLKNPSTVLSLVSEIIVILILFKVNVNVDIVTGVVTACCSILVLLGIMSNPTTSNKGYADDIFYCKNCKENTYYTTIGSNLYCCKCEQKYEK